MTHRFRGFCLAAFPSGAVRCVEQEMLHGRTSALSAVAGTAAADGVLAGV